MMGDEDLRWLTRQLMGTAELLGSELSPTAAAMMVGDLSAYPAHALEAALRRVRTEHTGKLTPKIIIDRIDEALGRPPANEAWAVASSALDERATVVWTGEMSDAWGLARPLAEAGDMIGARMAFIAAYERLVRTARDERRVPQVTVSLGWDKEAATAAIEKAVQVGYLTQDRAQQYLPAPKVETGLAVALLTGNVATATTAPPDVRDRLRELRDELANRKDADFQRRVEEREHGRRALAALKAETQERVNERMLQGGVNP